MCILKVVLYKSCSVMFVEWWARTGKPQIIMQVRAGHPLSVTWLARLEKAIISLQLLHRNEDSTEREKTCISGPLIEAVQHETNVRMECRGTRPCCGGDKANRREMKPSQVGRREDKKV